MMIKKTLTILAVSCMMYSCATKTESNPFLLHIFFLENP